MKRAVKDWPFDSPVRPGEIRIFADAKRPFLALVLEDRGLMGRRIVPVSPFPEPASGREIARGSRVFQLWNTCLAARRFTDRSWVVDALSEADLKAVAEAVPGAFPGRITAGDGPLARYERRHLVPGGTFRDWTRSAEKPRVLPRLMGEVWKVALSVAVCLGAFYLLIGPGRRYWDAGRDGAYAVRLTEEETVELAEAPAPEEREVLWEEDEGARVLEALCAELIAMGLVPPVVNIGPRVPDAPPAGPHGAVLSARTAPGLFAPAHLPGDGVLRAPSESPVSTLSLDLPRALGSAIDGARGGARPEAIREPRVGVRVAESPWDPLAVLLNVRSEDAEGGKVEVAFDPKKVRGYRLVAGGGTRPLNAFYEAALLPAGAEDLEGLAAVTVRWPGAEGERSRAVEVVRAALAELGELPANPHGSGAPALAAPDDVTVEPL